MAAMCSGVVPQHPCALAIAGDDFGVPSGKIGALRPFVFGRVHPGVQLGDRDEGVHGQKDAV